MKRALISRKLIKAVISLIILIYFAVRTSSPKIIFVPFIFCCFASIGKNIGLLFNRRKLTLFCDKWFKIVFFLAWFSFLIVACYIAVRDGNYKVIFFTIPFWIGGLLFAKRKLQSDKNFHL